jgi:hypothetical protein
METLADLMQIAEKHNCKICFGVLTSTEQKIDEDIIKQHGFTDELFEEMKDKMEIHDSASSFDKVWFELFDKSANSYSTMAYIESSTYFTVDKTSEWDFRYGEDEPSDDLIAWLDENDELWDMDRYTIHQQHNPTIIHGFGNKERVEDFRVYRSGMALKFFGDLVCDYLNEPRIKRCY